MVRKSADAKWRNIRNTVNKAIAEGDLTVGSADGVAKLARLRNMANGSAVDTPYELWIQTNSLNNPVDGGIAEQIESHKRSAKHLNKNSALDIEEEKPSDQDDESMQSTSPRP